MKLSLRNPYLWLAVCLVLSLFLLAYPLYVIRPFRHQGPRELMWALAVLRVRPALLLLCAIATVPFLVAAWRSNGRRWARTGAVAMALITCGCALLSRVNVYEKMFHPIDNPVFTAASNSKLDGAEQVIAVKLANAARAYPIRIISYHHIVNDVVAGVPIVATY